MISISKIRRSHSGAGSFGVLRTVHTAYNHPSLSSQVKLFQFLEFRPGSRRVWSGSARPVQTEEFSGPRFEVFLIGPPLKMNFSQLLENAATFRQCLNVKRSAPTADVQIRGLFPIGQNLGEFCSNNARPHSKCMRPIVNIWADSCFNLDLAVGVLARGPAKSKPRANAPPLPLPTFSPNDRHERRGVRRKQWHSRAPLPTPRCVRRARRRRRHCACAIPRRCACRHRVIGRTYIRHTHTHILCLQAHSRSIVRKRAVTSAFCPRSASTAQAAMTGP